jgi:drug/metabolite transporter (DMT)-like permease
MQRGVMYGVLAGAMWGFVFLGPRLLADFSPMLLSAGRYVMYGAVSLALALPAARRLAAKFTRADLIALVKLALIGNLVYYALLSSAIHLIGIAPSSLIVGVLPVTVTLAGRGDHGAVPLRRLALPLTLVLAGIACINVDLFGATSGEHGSLLDRLAGLGCALGALASWTWFAVANARYLRQARHFDGNEWSVVWGVVTGALGTLLWAGIALVPGSAIGQVQLPAERWHLFWAVNLALAIGGSWLGNALWNAASTRLPLTLSGQLIVFETLFALVYGFVYAQRLPRALEGVAIVLLVAGVSWSVRQHANAPAPSYDQRRALEDEAQAAAH